MSVPPPHPHPPPPSQIDALFCVLLLGALSVVGYCHPFHLLDRNPVGLALGVCFALPLAFLLFARKRYIGEGGGSKGRARQPASPG